MSPRIAGILFDRMQTLILEYNMRLSRVRLIIPIMLATIFLLACDEKPKNPVSEYGDAMVGAYKRGQRAGEEADLDAIKKTIQAYYAANEEYPKSLKEIEGMLQKPLDPDKYEYDPQTGAVTLKSK